MTSTFPPRQAATALESAHERLWAALIEGDERAAASVVLAELDGSLDHEGALLDLIAAMQHRVGEEWATNRLTVAAEHAITAINERVIAVLAHRAPERPADPPRGRVTVACVDGEWHALPARLLAETLRLRGWRVDFLGAQVPTSQLIAHLHQTGPDAVALSSSLPTRLPVAHAAVSACQAAGVPVIVGGAAFGADGRYARLLGADAWAPDARMAADTIAGRLRPPAESVGHQPIDDLPHLADQEYTMISRSAAQLVRVVWTELGSTGRLDDDHLVEGIAQLVDFLGAALYIDDDELFARYALWDARVGAARDVPVTDRQRILGVLTTQLTDFPRAGRALGVAARALTEVA